MVDQFGRWYPDYPGQQPYQDPAYMRAMGQPMHPNAAGNAPAQSQQMTPPTIHAEIVQVENLASIDRYPMGAGTSQMFITKDEQNIVVRSMYANGQHSDVIYDQRPPAPPAPTLNPDEYVRKDELGAIIAQTIQAQSTRKQTAKKEEAE